MGIIDSFQNLAIELVACIPMRQATAASSLFELEFRS